ncbi:MAG TPA: hypothetical protein VFO85_02515 [Vicinamibacteria bacterium]|nr:hypothetical protein [Vicinamibacteria bacterium]
MLEWDLSRSHSVGDVAWPPDNTRGQYFLKGDLHLTLKLPGRVLAAGLADVRVERGGDQVTVLQLRGHPLTLEGAVAEVERRMAEMDLPRRDFDQWRADAASGDFQRRRVFATRRNDLRPALSLEVKHTYDEARPWYLSWEIAWPGVAPAVSP